MNCSKISSNKDFFIFNNILILTTLHIYNINIFYIFILYMMTSVVDKYYRRIIQNIDNV